MASDFQTPLNHIPDDLRSLADYERYAENHMSSAAWHYLQEGAGAERSLSYNQEVFNRLKLIPRRLVDFRGASTETSLFNQVHAAPIMLAPVAYHKIAHPDGERATMTAATALNTTMIASTLSSFTMEEIADTARATAAELGKSLPPLWFQLYAQPDHAHTQALVQRAEQAGYQILVFTVDAFVKQSSFRLPVGVDAANLRAMPRISQVVSADSDRILFGTPLLDDAPIWDMLVWLRSITKLPIVIKGLLSPDDARLAVELGASGIIASNHGGRVLDDLVSPLDVLPAMLEAVDGQVPILLDSGVRSGLDVLKALALGASAVLIGRPQIHALAVAGIAGVAHMLHILRVELEMAMALTGCANGKEIGSRLLL